MSCLQDIFLCTILQDEYCSVCLKFHMGRVVQLRINCAKMVTDLKEVTNKAQGQAQKAQSLSYIKAGL